MHLSVPTARSRSASRCSLPPPCPLRRAPRRRSSCQPPRRRRPGP